MNEFNTDNEVIFDENDFFEENTPEVPEDSDFVEKENSDEIDPNNWANYVAEFGYDAEFLSDVETEEELFKKLKYFEDERKLEDAIADEEILEAIRLKKEGKITSIKDFAKHVYAEPETITEITTDEAAKEYLKNQMKAQGMKDKHIETILNTMEVNEELLTEANEKLKAEIENKQSFVEKRKAEYLEKQENERKAFVQEFNQKILQMKETVIEQGWNKELKDYVNEELVNTMLEMHTGKQTSKTLQKVAEALADNKKAPKLIAALHLMIQEDDINFDIFSKQQKSEFVKDMNKNWKSAISNKKIASGGNGFGKEANDLDWDRL